MEITKKTIKALASDTRLDILKILAKRRRIAADLAKDLGLAPSTVNEHLKKLEESELIRRKDTGHKWIYFEITKKGRNLVQPKAPVQLILILSLGFLMMVVGGFYSFLGEAKTFATEAAPTISKGVDTTNVVQYTGPGINWIGIIILAVGILLVIMGLYKILINKKNNIMTKG